MKIVLKTILIICILSSWGRAGTIKAGDVEFNIPEPIELKAPEKGDADSASLMASITPKGAQRLFFYFSPELLDKSIRDKPTNESVLMLYGFILSQHNNLVFGPEEFQTVIQNVKEKYKSNVVLEVPNTESVALMKKRLKELVKKSGIDVKGGNKPVSLGIVSENKKQITALMSGNSKIIKNGKEIDQRGFILTSFLNLKSKLVLVFSSISNDSVGDKDLNRIMEIHNDYITKLIANNKSN